MRLPKRGERGFTLIELLIVVAILGVLAAVVIPNVQRFIGSGKTEAAETELANMQTAVTAMMVDNEQSVLLHPVDGIGEHTATNDMTKFPDFDEVFVLYGFTDNGTLETAVNYVAANTTSQFYTVDETGTVSQVLIP